MQIEKRSLGDVTVLDVKGNLTLADGVHLALRDCMNGLLNDGCRKLVLNLEKVPYIDSTGLGEVVWVVATMHHVGGQAWLCHPTKRLKDVFVLTKLVSVFSVITPEEIVADLDKQRLRIVCPTCEPPSWIPLRAEEEYQECVTCGTQLKVWSWPTLSDGLATEVECGVLRFRTYDDEYVTLVIESLQTITIEQRLDLFASDVVQEVWRLLPGPRRVLFVVRQGQFTAAGLQPLLALCASNDDENRAAIVVTDVKDENRSSLPKHPAVYADMAKARAALADSGSRLRKIRLQVEPA